MSVSHPILALEVAHPFLAGLRVFNRRLATLLSWVAGGALGLLVAVVFFDVLCRQVLNLPILWPSEIAIVLFIWSVLCGAAVAAQRRSHFVVDLFTGGLPPAIERLLQATVAVCGLIFALVVVVYGWQMTLDGLQRFTPMKGYRMVYHFAAFPVAGCAYALCALEELLDAIHGTAANSAARPNDPGAGTPP